MHRSSASLFRAVLLTGICLAVPVWLPACRSAPPPPAARGESVPAAPSVPLTAAATTSRWRISEAESLLTIEVLRGGPLAQLGHNHVIAARRLTGELALAEPLESSTLSLQLAVDGFTVDEPALRAKAGSDFSAEVPESARTGTRANLLGPGLLDGEHFPTIQVTTRAIRRSATGYDVELAMAVRGTQSVVQVPVLVTRSADRIDVGGDFVLRQSQLGLTPFSIMMGALQVQDAMHLRFALVARPQAHP